MGTRIGIKPHTPWDDLVEIINDIQQKGTDAIITLGAGALTDGAKVITFVRIPLASQSSIIDTHCRL